MLFSKGGVLHMKYTKILAALIALLLLTGCAGGVAQNAPAPELLDPVTVNPSFVEAFKGEFYRLDSHAVSVVPYVEPIYSAVSGQIDQLYAYPGKEVKAGDILLTLSQSSLQAQLQNAENNLQRTKDNYNNRNAQAVLDIQILNVELRQLQSQNADASRIDLKKNEIAQAEATLRQEKAQQALDIQQKELDVEKARDRLGNNILRAPFDGMIVGIQFFGKSEIATGSNLSSTNPAFWIADNSRLALKGPKLSQNYFDRASRIYARMGSKEYSVRLMSPEEIDANAIADSSSSYYEFLDENGTPVSLELGQMGLICVLRDYVENAVLVSSNALLEDEAGQYVFVYENERRVRRDVTVGGIQNGLAYITSGVEEGELVYVD